MFGGRIQTMFSAMLPTKTVDRHRPNLMTQSFDVGDKVFVNSYPWKNWWEPRKFIQRLGSVLYRARGIFGTYIRQANEILKNERMIRTRNNHLNLPLELISDTSTTHTPKNTEKKTWIRKAAKKWNAVANQSSGYKWTQRRKPVPRRHWDGFRELRQPPEALKEPRSFRSFRTWWILLEYERGCYCWTVS